LGRSPADPDVDLSTKSQLKKDPSNKNEEKGKTERFNEYIFYKYKLFYLSYTYKRPESNGLLSLQHFA
jgi:hypothetical protein